MSSSVRPHRWQPTKLPRPWDSPGKNTGVGCHFLLQWMKVKSESEVAQSCLILRNPMDYHPPGSSVHGTFQARVLEWVAIVFSRLLPLETLKMLKWSLYALSISWISSIKSSEKAMAPHSSTLAWRIPRMGEPGGLPSMRLHRVGHD